MIGRAEQFLAKLCQMAIKLLGKQLLFGGSGRTYFYSSACDKM